MSGNLVKAKIFSKREVSGSITIGEHTFFVQFNPNEIRIEEAVGRHNFNTTINVNEKETNNKKISIPPRQLAEDKDKVTLSTSLFYNTYDRIGAESYKDVRTEIKKFYPFLNKNADTSKGIYKIGFLWGSLQVVGILSSMSVRYTLFAPDGTPVRAEMDISITGEYYDKSDEVKVSTEQSKSIILRTRGSLSNALASYSDPADWRNLLSEAGKINPRLLL